MQPEIQTILQRGTVIPAHPLALDENLQLDERRQRALTRYYAAAGAGGMAIGVHTTQFAIHNPNIGLYKPVLELAAEEMNNTDALRTEPLVRVAGICGETKQAVAEAKIAADLGYHAGLLSLSAMKHANEDELIAHCRAVAEVIGLFGFYLQPAVGGMQLPFTFWKRFAKIENVVGVKVAAFNRYQTLDVVRAIAESGRIDIALYTGNDDNIVLDLLTPFRFNVDGKIVEQRFVGGLLGHWSVWTKCAVKLFAECKAIVQSGEAIPAELLSKAAAITDMNAALFDVQNNFQGCVPGIHEILRRQGLLDGVWCIDSKEKIGPGQLEQLTRVCEAYPELVDDVFVEANRDTWWA